ncbi:hypothetical protein A5630_30025 [Mycolicibacterium mucogenicum]|uniref:Tetratricopeptide repeat protein n=1 Tax=Mycolicibacterium mucogenicum TaxID=56689 RepID=A0A1A3GQK1_MYCMU|nr:hypothetical protein [Mycolicibacterium mucogenicum]OBJ38307.1 hypothetical protein A5630_30025 [Mycolicibacterium mucogenicum]
MTRISAVWRTVVAAVARYFSSGPHRKVLRRRLLVISVLPALLVSGIAAKLVTMVVYGQSARSDYAAYNSYGMAGDVRKLKSFNVIDSYKAYFAEGDRYLLEGKLTDAEAEFKKSLDLVDQEDSCPVRINLEVVLEARGDVKNAEKHRDQAKPLWQEALTIVQQAPAGCFDNSTEPDEEQRKHRNETAKRLQDKLKDPEPKSSDGQGGGEGGEGGQGGGGGQGGSGQGGGQSGQGEQPPNQGGQPQSPENQPPSPGSPPPSPGEQGQSGGADGQSPAQGGPDGQAPAGGPTTQTPDTVGADRVATESGGVATHELHPNQGDPGDVLKRLLEDSGATGIDRE